MQWTPASGELSHVFDDELVCASVGVDAAQLRRIEPFPTGRARAVRSRLPGGLDGRALSDRSRRGGGAIAPADERRAARSSAAARCRATRTATSSSTPTFSDQTFKHILAPVWLLTYVYGAKSYQVVVNGVTGAIAGSRPWSWIKITLLVIALTIIAIMLMYANSSR